MQEYISFEEARKIVLREANEYQNECVSIHDTLYRTLGENIISRESIPPFDNSAMDGYAVRSNDIQDTPAVLKVILDIPAGVFPSEPLLSGTCARIMTGAPIPAGADAVVQVEWTEKLAENTVRILKSVPKGKNVRLSGQDVQNGQKVIEKGCVVSPPVIGMLATLGYANVRVTKKPKVAVITTGNELVDVKEKPGPGQIRDSNGTVLMAQVVAAGAYPAFFIRVSDQINHLRDTVQRAMESDIIVISGGISVGDYDYVKQVLEEAGTKMLFWRVRQRPGKPLAFGTIGSKLVFGLPGNPVSAAVNFEQYVRPTIATMLGRTDVLPTLQNATMEGTTAKAKGIHFFARGIAYYKKDGSLHVRESGPQASNIFSSVLRANCIIHLPEKMDRVVAGSQVQIEFFQWSVPPI